MLVPSLSRAFSAVSRDKTADVFLFPWSTSASLAASLWVRPLGLFSCYGFALQHISQRQYILPLTTVLSRGFENFFWMVLPSCACSSSIQAEGLSEFSYLAFTGLPRRAKPLCLTQRAGLYRDQLTCQGILRPIFGIVRQLISSSARVDWNNHLDSSKRLARVLQHWVESGTLRQFWRLYAI